MRRVQHNIELLIPRLSSLDYQFGHGFWDDFDDLSAEDKAAIENDIPIFKAPTMETPTHIALLEELTGTLPLSLRAWYEEVGSINFIGLFSSDDRELGRAYGCVMDPLFVYSIDMAIKMV